MSWLANLSKNGFYFQKKKLARGGFLCFQKKNTLKTNVFFRLAQLQALDKTISSNSFDQRVTFIKNLIDSLIIAKGSIVNISSVHAFATSKNISSYAATKGAILAFTRAISLELAKYKIRVNALLPGAVDTRMLREGLKRNIKKGKNLDNTLKEFEKKHPLGRIGKPEEIAKAIYFLADSNEASFITGQSLIVDGGAMAQLSTEV